MSTGDTKPESMSEWLDRELETNKSLYEALEGEPEDSDVSREDYGY